MSIGAVTTTLVSKLGSSSSTLPLVAKDTTCNFLISSLHAKKGGKRDGKERLIEEFGTEAIWILGIPSLKWLFNNSIYKIAKINPKFDVRKFDLKEPDNINVMLKKLSPDSSEYKDLTRIASNQKLTKGLHIARFVATTGLTLLALGGLIKYKQNQTKKDIEAQTRINFEKNKKNTTEQNDNFVTQAFKGTGAATKIAEFMFNPQKNTSILDGGISTMRIKEARKGELPEILLKEGGTIAGYYFLQKPLQKFLNKNSEKIFKTSSELDYSILSSKKFNSFLKQKDATSVLDKFLKLSDSEIIDSAFDCKNPVIVLIKDAKDAGILKTTKKTNSLDVFSKIDTSQIKETAQLIKEFADKQAKSGIDLDKYISKARKIKAATTFINFGASVLFVGVLIPKMIFLYRKLRYNSSENPAIKNIENECSEKFAGK